MNKLLLPDEYRRSGLVTVHMDSLEASLFSPKKLAALRDASPGHILRDSVAIEERYIVAVHRIDAIWEYEQEHDGIITKIPGPVFDRMASYRQSIIKEGRQRRAKQQFRQPDDQER